MAYFNNTENENEDDNSQGMNEQKNAQGQPVQLSNQSSTVSSSSAPAGPKAAKPASSGSAPGFQNYAKANQGKAQDNLNSAVAKNVTNAGQSATNSINQATQSFGKKVDAGTLENRQNAVQDVSSTVNSARNIAAPDAGNTGVAGGNAAGSPVPANNNTLSGMDENQVKRFQDVINAQYQGPESLRQSGLYNQISGKVDAAQNTINNTKTTLGREELLKQMFQQRGDYTSGLNKLDSALLNSSQQGVSQLQAAAQNQGNVAQKLDQAQIASANLAQNRTQEIKDIRQQARDTFTAGKKAEEAATEARLDEMLVTPVKDVNGNVIMKPDGTPMTQWDQLPESFRDVIRNKEANNTKAYNEQVAKLKQDSGYDKLAAQQKQLQAEVEKARISAVVAGRLPNYNGVNDAQIAEANANYKNLQNTLNNLNAKKSAVDNQLKTLQSNFNPNAVNFNSLEAAMLGVDSGEGLYNLGENAIKTGVAERDRLVSRDEQARQAALAALAGLDLSNQLDTNLRYDDATKAGTQSIMDSLDLQGTRAALNEAEKNFRNTAENTTITGYGRGKSSQGNAFGSKSKTATVNLKGQAGDFLEKAGYDLDAPIGQGSDLESIANQQALLKAALQASDRDTNIQGSNTLQSGAQGAAAGASLGSAGGPVGAAIGAGAGGAAGLVLGSGTFDQLQQYQDILSEIGLGGIADAIQDGRNTVGNAYGDLAKYNPMNFAADTIGKALGLGSLTGGIAGAISGIDTKALKQKAKAKAQAAAVKNLQKNYEGFLDSQGFENRANVVDNSTTTSRISALQQLLANLDKTNV